MGWAIPWRTTGWVTDTAPTPACVAWTATYLLERVVVEAKCGSMGSGTTVKQVEKYMSAANATRAVVVHNRRLPAAAANEKVQVWGLDDIVASMVEHDVGVDEGGGADRGFFRDVQTYFAAN
jgi:hypothetical protein